MRCSYCGRFVSATQAPIKSTCGKYQAHVTCWYAGENFEGRKR